METKSSNKVLVVVAVVLVLLGLGGVAYAFSREEAEPKSSTTEQTAEEMGMTDEEHANMDKTTESNAQSDAVITFTDDGYDKSTYTFPAGTTITVKNESSMDMQFSSDDHPTHRDHTELNMPIIGAGESGTFTPPGAGTYGFHDHINDQYEGTLIIE